MKHLLLLCLLTFSSIYSYTQETISSEADSMPKQTRLIGSDTTLHASDSAGSYKAPVKILSVSIEDSSTAQKKDVSIRYKSASHKDIIAIKFRWKGIDDSGALSQMGFTLQGYGVGFIAASLKAHDKEQAIFEVMHSNVKKILYAWVSQVVYNDGSVWKQ